MSRSRWPTRCAPGRTNPRDPALCGDGRVMRSHKVLGSVTAPVRLEETPRSRPGRATSSRWPRTPGGLWAPPGTVTPAPASAGSPHRLRRGPAALPAEPTAGSRASSPQRPPQPRDWAGNLPPPAPLREHSDRCRVPRCDAGEVTRGGGGHGMRERTLNAEVRGPPAGPRRRAGPGRCGRRRPRPGRRLPAARRALRRAAGREGGGGPPCPGPAPPRPRPRPPPPPPCCGRWCPVRGEACAGPRRWRGPRRSRLRG